MGSVLMATALTLLVALGVLALLILIRLIKGGPLWQSLTAAGVMLAMLFAVDVADAHRVDVSAYAAVPSRSAVDTLEATPEPLISAEPDPVPVPEIQSAWPDVAAVPEASTTSDVIEPEPEAVPEAATEPEAVPVESQPEVIETPAPTPEPTPVPTPEPVASRVVYIATDSTYRNDTGSGVYHSTVECSGMKHWRTSTVEQAEAEGRDPCKRCW